MALRCPERYWRSKRPNQLGGRVDDNLASQFDNAGKLPNRANRNLAFALLEVEKGFRRISGHKDMPLLMAALERKSAEG